MCLCEALKLILLFLLSADGRLTGCSTSQLYGSGTASGSLVQTVCQLSNHVDLHVDDPRDYSFGARVVPHDLNHSLMRPWIEGDADVWVYKDENEQFVMPCFAHADPDPDVTWYKYDIRVTPDYRRHIREDHSLAIEIADMMDTGTYQCRAANQYGMARKTYHVIIMPDSLYK